MADDAKSSEMIDLYEVCVRTLEPDFMLCKFTWHSLRICGSAGDVMLGTICALHVATARFGRTIVV